MLIVPQQTVYNFVKCTKLKIILLNYERKHCNLLASHDVVNAIADSYNQASWSNLKPDSKLLCNHE